MGVVTGIAPAPERADPEPVVVRRRAAATSCDGASSARRAVRAAERRRRERRRCTSRSTSAPRAAGRWSAASTAGGSSSTEVRRFPTRSVRLPDGLYWDVLGLFGELTSALAERARVGRDPCSSVGVDSWGVDFGLLDAQGTLIANPLSSPRRPRRRRSCSEALRRVSRRRSSTRRPASSSCRSTRSSSCSRSSGASASSRAETLLLIPDLLAYWLTGERRAEATNASTTQLLDAQTGDWAEQPDRAARPAAPDLPADRARPGSIARRPAAARRARRPGCRAATPVIAVASHDTASAVVAVPSSSGTTRRTSRAAPGRSSGSSSPRRSSPPQARSGEPHERAGLRRHDPAAQERDGPLARPGMPARLAARRRCAELRGPRGARRGGAPAARCSTPTSPSCWLRATCPPAFAPPARERGQAVPDERAGADPRDLREPRLQVPARARARSSS